MNSVASCFGVGCCGTATAPSAGEGLRESEVIEAVLAGETLHRLASARAGFDWVLRPSGRPVPRRVAEAAAADARLQCDDGPVGRVVWTYRARSASDSA